MKLTVRQIQQLINKTDELSDNSPLAWEDIAKLVYEIRYDSATQGQFNLEQVVTEAGRMDMDSIETFYDRYHTQREG